MLLSAWKGAPWVDKEQRCLCCASSLLLISCSVNYSNAFVLRSQLFTRRRSTNGNLWVLLSFLFCLGAVWERGRGGAGRRRRRRRSKVGVPHKGNHWLKPFHTVLLWAVCIRVSVHLYVSGRTGLSLQLVVRECRPVRSSSAGEKQNWTRQTQNNKHSEQRNCVWRVSASILRQKRSEEQSWDEGLTQQADLCGQG